jgi:gamma-glutamyltranspeptidase/glutathione hydrolase
LRDFQLPGRSAVHCVNGAAATSHPLSTLTALEILKAGGNAMDAAIAACAVQCVVEPASTGIGGDCFALLQKGGEGPVIGFNGSGAAPAGLTADWLLGQGIKSLEPMSPHCVTVPGAIDGWARLAQEHGRLGLDRLLQPAIGFAEHGFAVTPRISVDWKGQAAKLAKDENSRRVFLRDGRAPQVGEVFAMPQLAQTLKAIARQGRDAFYRGPVAEDMVSYLQSLGGKHTLEDFAAHAGEYVTPISTRYRGFDVTQIPPNGQGIVALIMLNILSGFDLAALDPVGVARQHLEIEATRLAYHARNLYVADPRQADVPVKELLSEAYAAEQRVRISPDRAMQQPGGPTLRHRDTVYISVVDRDLNAVSFINSLFVGFGSGLTSPNTGVIFHNRGSGFVVEPGHPNCVAPRKRPMHTIIPGMVLKDGRCELSYGVMGGAYQATGHTHFLTNVFDYGMDVQEAIDAPRSFHVAGQVEAERGFSADVLDGLRALGHKVVMAERAHGGGQAIRIDRRNGTLSAGSDPRKDGCALGY